MKKNLLLLRLLAMMTAMVVIQLCKAQSISYGSVFDLAGDANSDNRISVNTEQPGLSSAKLSADGLTLFTIGSADDEINQYSLSVPFDLGSTITHQGLYSVSVAVPTDFTFSPDGSRLFIVDNSTVYQYAVSTPFDVTGTVTFTQSASVTSNMASIKFSNDGMTMFIGRTSGIFQYSLTTAFDVGSFTFDGFNNSSTIPNSNQFAFNDDGTTLFTASSGGNIIQYTLVNPFDVTTGATGNTKSVTTENFLQDLSFSPDGTKFFISNGLDQVAQYDLGPPTFKENAANNGGLNDTFRSFSLTGDTFTNAGGNLTLGTHYQIPNLPAGLTPIMSVDGSGTFIDLSFSGNVTNHDNTNDVASLTFNFLDAAFTGGDASSISNAQNADTGVALDFRTNQTPFIGYSSPNVSTANIESTTFSVASEDVTPAGMTFNSDGTRLFMVGLENANIIEYSLTNPYQITSGITATGNTFDLSTEETLPQGIQFNNDGSKFYILGASGKDINQYGMSSSYDITSTITHEGTFSIASETSNPEAFFFSPNGETVFVLGLSGGLSMYFLSTRFDITSGVTFEENIGINGRGIFFNQNGKELYINSGASIQEYTLEVPFNISFGTTTGDFHSFSSAEGQSLDLFISPDNSTLLILGNTGDDITQFALPRSSFTEPFANDGSQEGTFDISISEDFFANAGGTLQQGVHYDITNLPTGLSSVLDIDADGTTATLSLTGNSNDNDLTDNLSNLIFSFNDNAFVNSSAGGVINATNANSYFNLSFKELNGIISSPGGYTLSNFAFSGTLFSFSSLEGNGQGLAFSNDGTRMFIAGRDGDDVTYFNLSTAFDLSTATPAGAFNVSGETTNPFDIAFNNDGTKMFIIGDNNLYQYTLSNSFDLSSAVSLDGSRVLNASKIAFSSDGSRLIVLFGTQFIQYELSTPFDITDAISETGSIFHGLSISAGIAFSADGNTLFGIRQANDRIYAMGLTAPFDITGGVSTISILSVSSQEFLPFDIAFSPDGSRLFLSGGSDEVNEYEISITDLSEANANDGSVTGSFNFDISGEVFSNAGASLTLTDDYSITNVPAGLAPDVTIDADGQGGSLSFSGQATDHQNVDDVTSFTLTFENSAFGSNDASSVLNAQFVINAGIDFDANGTLSYSGTLRESFLNDGTVSGEINIGLLHTSFSNVGATLTAGTDYNITGIPNGLTPVITINSSNSATFTLSGTASDHQNAQDVADLVFNFESSAFINSDVQYMINAVNHSTGIGINFDDNEPRIRYGSTFDLSTEQPELTNHTFDFDGQDTSANGFTFNNDGTKLFMVGSENDAIYEYTVGTPFDLSGTITYTGNSYDVSSEEPLPHDVNFNDDGTKMYVLGTQDEVYQYNLSNPFDLSGTITLEGFFDFNQQDISADGIDFSADGLRLYMIGSFNDDIFQYSLTTPFDITSGVTYDNAFFSVNSRNYGEIVISEDGRTISISNSSFPGGAGITQYTFNTPFDIADGLVATGAYGTSTVSNGLGSFAISNDRKRLITLGDVLYQFDLPIDGFDEISINNGEVEGSMKIDIFDETFTQAGGTLTHGTDFTISNLPAGLTASIAVSADGYSGTLNLSGAATDHQDANDVNDLLISFNNSAFSLGNAANVSNSANASTSRSINFNDNNPALFYGDPLKPANITFSGNQIDVSLQDNTIKAVAFSADGLKMYTGGSQNDKVYEYTVAKPFDFSSTVTFTGIALDISTQGGSLEDIYLSPDGSRLFVAQTSTSGIVQYNLATPFDLSTSTYSGNTLDTSNEETDPYSLTFSPNGLKMYLAGDDQVAILQYSLSTAFDLSGVTYDGMTEEIQEYEGMAISSDGRYILTVGGSDAYRYVLRTPFDITQGVTEESTTFDFSNEDGSVTGVFATSSGGQIFVTSDDVGEVLQYSVNIGGFSEASANDGSVEGTANIIMIDGTFSQQGSSLTSGTDFTINNLPNGLMASLAVAADGYSAVLTLSGATAEHGNADDLESLEFSFNSSAFTEFMASEVSQAENASSRLGIDFSPYTENDIVSFTFSEIDGSATINSTNHTVVASAIAGTDVSSITPTVSLSQNATSIPNSGIQQNFSNPVTYIVTAEDGTPQTWGITITETPAAPTDIALSSDNIDENQLTNSTVGNFSTTDASFNDSHTYSLVSGAGDDDNGAFSISGDGLITSFSGDFETQSIYQVRVQTDDGNGGQFEKAFTINLNNVNEGPTDLEISGLTIDESSNSGTVIGTFTTTDEDTDDSFTYTLVSGTGDTDNASFNIVGDELVSVAIFDFETQNSYSIHVQSEDEGGLTISESYTIQINDLPPQVTSITLDPSSVAENEVAGTVVGSFTTLGEDLSGSYTYTLVSGSGDDDNSSFSISDDELLTGASFNFEEAASYSIRVKTDDGAGNTLESAISVSITDVFESTDANISGFVLTEQTGDASIDGTEHTITIEVERGTDLTDLTPTITISNNATVSPLSGVSQDFSNPVTYTVTAEDATTTQDWIVTVTEAPNTETDILSFTLTDQASEATIDAGAHTVEIAVVHGTDLAALSPTITLSEGATISPESGTSQDLSLSTTYTVTAEDGTTSQDWSITVTEAPNTATDILTFVLTEQTGSASIDTDAHTVAIEVERETDLTQLTPTITTSEDASVVPASGTELDLSSTTTFTVTAEDGTTVQDWTITVTEALNTETDILTFTLAEAEGNATINTTEHTVVIEVVHGTDLSSLSPTLTLSDGATVDPSSGAAQDFSSEVTFTVTAEDGNTAQDWTVTVTEALNTETNILTFVLGEETGSASIDATSQTVTIEVANGTDLSSLTPTITLSEGASIDPASGTSQDFSTAVTYTVTAEDGLTSQDWTVTVTEAPSTATDILTFALTEQSGSATIDATNHTVSIEVVHGTDLTGLTPTLTLSAGASANPGSGTSQDFSSAVTYTITAEDGTTTQDWIVSVTEAQRTGTDILSFTFAEATGEATINTGSHTVNIEVIRGSDLSSLTPTIQVSSGAIINPGSGTSQDFSDPVSYLVTAENGSTQSWTVTVTTAFNVETDILSFELSEQTGNATIDLDAHTIDIEVSAGTDLTNLSPEITISEGATINPASQTTVDFNDPVTYTVTAEDEQTQQEWTVTVTEALALSTVGKTVLQIYPNPTEQWLYIRQAPNHAQVALFNSSGKLVKSGSYEGEMQMDLRDLPAGIYHLRIYNPSTAEIHNNKIIKR